MNFPHGETVTIVRPATVTDRYNNQVPDWDNATEYVLRQCAIAPGSVNEVTEGRENGLEVDFTVFVSPAAGSGCYGWSVSGEPLKAIKASDRLQFRGDDHDVIGPIEVWVNPFTGWRPGCVVMVKRREG